MKNFLFTCITFSFIGILLATGQISQSGQPNSFKFQHLSQNLDKITLSPPDSKQIAIEDLNRERYSAPYRIGINLPFGYDMTSSGTWTDLPNGEGKIWRLEINAPGAQGQVLYYDRLYIPRSCRLYVYSGDRTFVLGAYTEVNNTESGSFANEIVPGETVILEYFQPEGITEKAIISIEEIGYIYRGNETVAPASGACEVNVICSEGTNWMDEKDGVVKLLIKIGLYTYLCSGSVMNNTLQNCTPYVLLADHCTYDGGYATVANMNQWVFYFHYEASSCAGTTASGTKTMTGCTLKARDTYGQTTYGSDFCLVQLNAAIPSNYNCYYSGWDRSGSTSASGVGIHHPAGDIKKISTYSSSLTAVTYGGASSHWRVTWVATTNGHGVTEGGSSGSPLFSSAGRILGTLTGGSSYCATPNDPDYYGRFSKHWMDAGSTDAKRLKPWLDPLNLTSTTLDGTYNCVVGIGDKKQESPSISIFPNPASESITVTLGDIDSDQTTVSIYNLLGSLVFSSVADLNNEKQMTLDIRELPSGIYFLGILTGGIRSTRKFTVIK